MTTDHQYQGFMDALALDQRGKNALNLPEWEVNFLAGYQRSGRPSLWFTPGRRPVVDRMWMKWGPDLGLPHPIDTVSERPTIEPADTGGCEHLVKGEDGRQSRCNEPAICRESRQMGTKGLRYCEMHAAAVERTCPKIVLIKLQPENLQQETKATKGECQAEVRPLLTSFPSVQIP